MVGLSKLFAIGDMHGCVDSYAAILSALGIVDADGRWCGGTSRVVQTGDLIDRGPKSLACLRFTMQLSQQAEQVGGRVVFVLGNHEVFAMSAARGNDWAFLNWFPAHNGGSSVLIEWMSEDTSRVTPECLSEMQRLYAQFFSLFSERSVIGGWLSNRPTCAVLDDTLFVHAGISRDTEAAAHLLNEIARQADYTKYLIEPSHPVLGRRGPYWVRDLAREEVVRALKANGVKRMVTGHNPHRWVTSAYDDMLLVIDTAVVKGGPALGVEISADGLEVWDTKRSRHAVSEDRYEDNRSRSQAVTPAKKARFARGDTVLFYASPVSGGMACLAVHDAWSVGEDTFYDGAMMAYMPSRDTGRIRYSSQETWTYPGAFIDRVGVPVARTLDYLPPEMKNAIESM